MEIVRLADARPYDAPRHHAMTALRLQGHDASSAETSWVGLSHFLPGGGAERSSNPLERLYIVVEGEITIGTDDAEHTLRPLDSCRIAPHENRSLENRTNRPASLLVVMPYG